MYSLELSNGATVENLKINCNVFISGNKIDAKIFAGNLNSVTVVTPNGSYSYSGIELVDIWQEQHMTKFILGKIPPEKIREQEMLKKMDAMDAQASYTAMMTDTLMEV